MITIIIIRLLRLTVVLELPMNKIILSSNVCGTKTSRSVFPCFTLLKPVKMKKKINK